MAQGSRFQLLFSENHPQRDVNEMWQHDLYEPYEALFRADEQQSPTRDNRHPARKKCSELERNVDSHRLAQKNWSDLELNVKSCQPAQILWSDLERNAANRKPAQINLSNLEQNVSTDDLFVLFSPIGDLRNIYLNCDKYGRPKGTAIVVFEQKTDAMEAMQRYNGCLLDNRILKMELMHSLTSLPVSYKNNISNHIQ